MRKINVVTLFPEMLEAITGYGITGRAIEQKLLAVDWVNPRDFTEDRHKTVDDRPYGGGPGMLMKVEPLERAVLAAKQRIGHSSHPKVIYLSPQGKPLDQETVKQLVKEPALVLVAGRYEGVDERFIDRVVDEEYSIGDYVLSGGELPAMVLIDAITRLIPGALGHELSAEQDSFSDGLLDCPHYTRPSEYQGSIVPDVLQSGNHDAIKQWRLQQSLGRTWLRRPEILKKLTLTKVQQQLLTRFIKENNNADSDQ